MKQVGRCVCEVELRITLDMNFFFPFKNGWRSTTICVISTLGLIWTTCNRRPTQALALWWSGQRNLFLTHRCVEQKLKKKKIPSIEHRHPLDRFLASYIDKVEKGDEAWARKDFGNLNWTQFVDRMLETRPDTWNEHWAPIHHLCPPCIRWIRWTRWIPQYIRCAHPASGKILRFCLLENPLAGTM